MAYLAYLDLVPPEHSSGAGKSSTVVTTAIARELAGFAWAIAKRVQVAGA